jgi:hypothetical protein
MLVLVAITAGVQIGVSRSFDREPNMLYLGLPTDIELNLAITEYLPMSLATKKMAEKYQKDKERRKSRHDGVNLPEEDDNDMMDLFRRDRKLGIFPL